MSQSLQKYGPLRKKWESWLGRNPKGFRSIRQVSMEAGVINQQLTKAINDGFASENIRTALAAIEIPDHLIPLPSCTRSLAGIIYQQQELLNRCQKI